jgi:hypothetical protein
MTLGKETEKEHKIINTESGRDSLRKNHLPEDAPQFEVAIVRYEIGKEDQPEEIMLFFKNDISCPGIVYSNA